MTLPWQALSVIAAYSNPSDVVSLLVAQPDLAPILLPRLYGSITIDVGKRDINCFATPGSTLIRTTRGFRHFLQVIGEDAYLAQYVRRLEVRSNIPLSDLVMTELLSTAFANLNGLESLYWTACPELSLSILALLPCPEQLEELVADLAIRPEQNYPPIDLSALRVLKIQPFLNEACLGWLSEATQTAKLEVLSLSRDLKKAEVGSGYAFVGAEQAAPVPLEAFFRPNASHAKWQLKELALQGFTTNGSMSPILEAIDTSKLEVLSLSGVDYDGMFLREFTGKLAALERLDLEFKAPIPSICTFLESLQISHLKVHIYNDARTVLEVVSWLPLVDLEIKGDCYSEALQPLCRLPLESLALPLDLSQSWQIAKQFRSLKTLSLSPSRTLCGEMSWQWLLGELKGVKVDMA